MPQTARLRLLAVCAAVAVVTGCPQPAEKVFAYSTDAPSRAGLVAVAAGGVLVGNEAGRLVRLGRSGQVEWAVELGSEVAARPALASTEAEEAVVAGTVAGVLVRLALATGEERWRLTHQPRWVAPLVADGEQLYAVTAEGSVRAQGLVQGAARWQQAPFGAQAPTGTQALWPTPVLAGELLVVATPAGVAALATGDGAVRWARPLPQVLGLELEGQALYASTRGGKVVALGLEDGEVRWERAVAPLLTSPPTLAQGRLWVGAPEAEAGGAPQLLGLVPESGEEVARLKLPAPLVTRVAAYNSLLLVPGRTRQGLLVALVPSRPEPAFTLQLDTPLPMAPVVQGNQLYVLGMDGRVLSWRLK